MQLDHNYWKLSYEDLVDYTNNFSQSNYIGRFQFGKLYHGKVDRVSIDGLTVKMWEIPEIYSYKLGDNERRLMKELILLRHEMVINHPGMPKLYEYYWEGEDIGIAYEFKPFDSLFNIIPKDDFTWLQRIKVAVGLASLIKYLHAGKPSFSMPFIIQNLDASHILIDEEYNPKLCDFGLLSGGIFPPKKIYSGHVGCYGYVDTGSSSAGKCSKIQDVFAFGVILLGLISKRVYTEEDRFAGEPYVYEWALREAQAFESDGGMKNTEFSLSLVHKSLAMEYDFGPGDGHKLTKLALDCVNANGAECQRPTMKQVYKSLLKLEAVKQHAGFFGVK